MKKNLLLTTATLLHMTLSADLSWKSAAEIIKNASLTIKETLYNDENLYKETADSLSYFNNALHQRQEYESKVIDCIKNQYNELMTDLKNCNNNTSVLRDEISNRVQELNIALIYEQNKAAQEIQDLTKKRDEANAKLAEVTKFYNEVVQESNEDAKSIITYLQSVAHQWDAMIEQKNNFYNNLYTMSEAINKNIAGSAKNLQNLNESICNDN